MTSSKTRPGRSRRRSPVPEYEGDRTPDLGYESCEPTGWIRCLAHGYPTPLARWHCHEEFELHLITATSGHAFVGDWVGSFRPGHLVLCGSQLPHNWVSVDAPPEGVTQRDLVIQFRQEPLLETAGHIPEFHEITAMLKRARHGIEFFGMSDTIRHHWHRVRDNQGLRRVMAFMTLMTDLAQCEDYRLLSSPTQGQSPENLTAQHVIQHAIRQITANSAAPVSLTRLAEESGMSESRFSRLFQRTLGHSLTDFVNALRIDNACHLLIQTDRYINDICYQVGFNNLANFNRRFLAIKGITPSEFRRQAANRFLGAPSPPPVPGRHSSARTHHHAPRH